MKYHQRIQPLSLNLERSVFSEPNKENKRSPFDVCYKYILAYCKETTLHGLQYAGNPKISFGERACWLLCFCTAVMFAGYFVSLIYVNYNKTPVIITHNPLPMSVTEIPFPALTVCGLNKVSRSFARDIETNGTDLEKNLLLDYCDLAVDLNITKNDYRGTTSWHTFLEFLVKASPSCNKMIKACFWNSDEIDCAKWFNPSVTDSGLCCTFNQMPHSYIFRSAEHFNELSYTYPQLVEDWTQEDGYGEDVPEDVFPWRTIGSGSNLGLTLVLDCAVDEYYCSSASSTGFKTLLRNPLETPSMLDHGRLYEPGKESWVEIEPSVIETSQSLRTLAIEKRLCYFNNEKYLHFYRLYTQRNCIMECQTNYSLKICNCVPFFLPRERDARVCGFKDKNCSNYAEVKMKTEEVLNRGVCNCLPGCYELSFEKTSHDALLHKSTVKQRYYKNMSVDYFVKNGIIVHYYFYSPLLTKYIKRNLLGFSEFLSNTGGLLGLFLGFSVLSAVELGYYLSLRICCFMKRSKENKRLQDLRRREHDVVIFPFVN